MNSIRFHVSAPRFILARALGRFTESVTFGRLSGLSADFVELPELPGPEWVELDVILCGICGTDLGNLTFSASPALEPFASFPAVLGHEVLARVRRTGAAVDRLSVGDRVAVDPMISCETRGHPGKAHCPSCRQGRHATCERAGEDGTVRIGTAPLAPGLTIGYHRDLPGGWGPRILAHQSQVFAVHEALDDRVAVLTEPISIGVHAALNSRLANSGFEGAGPVLVIGSGPIAFGTLWALRALGYDGPLVAQAKRAHEAELARRLGASDVVAPGAPARQAMIETGASAYMPLLGEEVFEGGGFPVIFDCVGSKSSLEQSLRMASPRGQVVMLGCAAEIPKLDLTFVWARELDVKGFIGYGRERWGDGTAHTFQVTLELMETHGDRLAGMVTHVFPLTQYRDALSAAANHRRSKAIKVALRP